MGEGLVAIFTNFHDWQKNHKQWKPDFSKYVSSIEIGIFHALTQFQLKND